MKTMVQPHIKLTNDRKFKRAIVCGAPERAMLIASRLDDQKELKKNREYHSYLGFKNGQEILVMSHGVGAPGAAICFHELIEVGVEQILRVGTAGGLYDACEPGDIVIPTACIRDDGVTHLSVPDTYPAVPDLKFTNELIAGFEAKSIPARHGITVSTDLFYQGLLDPKLDLYQKSNALAVEMECSALFVIGSIRKIRTGAILVTDGNPLKWSEGNYDPTSNRLQTAVETSIDVALEVLSKN